MEQLSKADDESSVRLPKGAVNSGHYVTYRKGAGDKWFLTSDEKVEEIDESQVKAANAYMLFYERQPQPAVIMRPLSPD